MNEASTAQPTPVPTPSTTVGNWLRTLGRWLAVLWTGLFGTWQPPSWLCWMGGLLGRGASRSAKTVRARPGMSLVGLALLAALGVGGYFGYAWWKARPQPVQVNLVVTNPALTEFAKDAAEGGAPKPVVVKFSASVAPLALVGKTVSAGITTTPAVQGTWKWVSDQQLEFTPKAEWPVGAEYQVVLERSAIAPQIKLEKNEFTFATAGFAASIKKAEFYQDPINPTIRKAVIELGFTHPVNAAELEKRIELQLAGQAEGVLGVGREKTLFTITYDKLKLAAYVHSAVLSIPKESTNLKLTLAPGVMAQAGGAGSALELAQDVSVPGLYSLSMSNFGINVVTNERYEPEQVLMVETSQLVHEKEVVKNISAWVLPLQNPSVKKEEQTTEPYAWSSTAEVSAEVLKRATKLDLFPIPAEQEHTQAHAFKFKADVGRMVYLQVGDKVKSFSGYLMRNNAQTIVTVPPYPSELRILSQGALLPMSGEKKVAVLVRDLPGMQIEVSRVQPSQLQHLVSQTQGNFSNPDFINSFGADNIAERFERKLPLPALQRGKPHYESIDLADYLVKGDEPKRGLFLLKVQGYDPKADPKIPANKAKQAAPDPNDPAQVGAEASENTEGDRNGGAEGDTDSNDPSKQEERRLLLVTDLGLLIKQSADGSRDVFVQSIFSGEPVAGVTVEVLAKNGSTLFSQITDAAGRVHFEKLAGLVRERAPLMVVAKKAGDMSFMPLNRNDRQLDYSRFDVGGMQSARSTDQLNAYLFSDRGIYRPGETMHIGMVIKAADWAKPLVGVPLEAEVLDARGLVVKRERVRVAAGGFMEISHATQETSPVGNYTVNLNIMKGKDVLRQLGSTNVKVQEFMPDRMKVSANLMSAGAPVAAFGDAGMSGWVSPKELKGRINAQNLFGTPAENRRVELGMTLSPAYPAFKAHADYQFYDPQRAKEGFSENLPEAKTNAQGDAEFELNLARYARATYRLSLLGKVFEPEGGRSVAAEASVLVSEQPYLVGVKNDGDLGFVSRGSKRISQLISIDPQTKLRATDGLTLQLVERKVVSVLMRQPNETYRYESRKKEAVVKEEALNIPAKGHSLALDTQHAGNFSYVVRDAAGVEMSRIDYSVAGQGNVTRSLERNAELQLTLNKKDYEPGDEMEVSIRAPYVGAGLITIERDKVYTQAWFKTTTTASVQKIKLPADFEGNGYVNVQFIRDPSSEEIFMSPLSYGVAPFATSLAKRTNTVQLSVPELTKPGQVMKIKLAASKPTRAVVFAIDEGILQVARYQAADPLGHFFQKRALEVKSSQILDLILPEFKRLMAAAAPGGDAAGANARFLNPFKRKGEAPAVYWSGIVDIGAGAGAGAGAEQTFNYTVPDHFNGTLRVMAVVVNDNAVGVAQTKALVRGDFVISPNLPLMVAPGDVFDVSVGVANNIVGAANDSPVQLKLKPPPTLEVVGPATQTLNISGMREGVATYKLRVKDAQTATLGSATLEFTTSLGTKFVSRKLDLSVRPASPLSTTLALGSFTGSKEVPTPRDLVAEFRKQEVAVSVLPLALAPGLMSYLDNFEHACTEQLVSRALPALVLARRPEFAQDRTAAVSLTANATKTLENALRVLRTRQNAQGGFGLWTASVQADEFASVYAVHMMLEARELEVAANSSAASTVPPDLLQKSIEYLQQLASSNPADLHAARSRAYAIYLLTRNGAVTTPLLAGLRETLDAKFAGTASSPSASSPSANTWKLDATAAFMASTYQLLKQEKPATELIDPLVKQLESGKAEHRYAHYSNPTIRDAQLLYLLARHFPPKLKALGAGTFTRFMQPLANGNYNTVSAAWSILAIEGMARSLGSEDLGKLGAVQVNAQGTSSAVKLPANLLPRASFDAGTVKLKLSNDNAALTTWYAVTQTGFDRTPPMAELKSGLEVVREYVGADGKPISGANNTVKIGDEVSVKLSLRGMALAGGGANGASDTQVGNVALTDLLPGGFEPVQQRDANGAATTVSGPALEFADVREDRVVIYASATDSVQTYTYRIRATNLGEFTVPPAFAQSMYERERQARSLPGRVVVSR
jgi:alpha-2-macroglobulin